VRRRSPKTVQPDDLTGLRCAQYIRDSTEHQRDGFGPEMQRSSNRRFAERYGLIDTELEFVEFVSAFQGVQGELDRAIQTMKTGKFRVLLVGWAHRLTRSLERAAHIERAVVDAGGWVVYSDTGRIAGADWVNDTITNFTNEMFSRNLSRLVASGLEEKFQSGAANGNPPLGTKHVYRRRDGSLAGGPEVHTVALREVDDATLPALHALLDHYASHGSSQGTANYLNMRGFRTKRGGAFTCASVKEIIRNPFYGPEEIIRYHSGEDDERLVPTPESRRLFADDIHDLWLRANVKRERIAAKTYTAEAKRIYPLNALLRCSECHGQRFHGQWSRHGYRLTRHMDAKINCPHPRNIRAESLETQIAEFLMAVEIPRNWRSQIAKLRSMPNDLPRERDRLQGALQRLQNLHLWGDIDEVEYMQQRNSIKHQIATLPQPIQTIEQYREPVDRLRTIGFKLKRLLATGKPEALALFREFCETAFMDISVSGDVVTEVNPADRYREMMAIGLRDRVCYSAVKRTRTYATQQFAVPVSVRAIFLLGNDSNFDALQVA
jgi:DNA invertase Pin-like site-specific DNA recombinase